MENEDDSFWGKYGIRLLLVFFALFGALLVGVFEEGAKFSSKFLEHLSMAVSVAGIIGITIEFTLQQQIIKNVFRTAIGYLLPERLRSELQWIYGLSWLCESYVQTVCLEEINKTDLVRVTTSVLRTVKNISDQDQTYQVGVGVDEWFHENHPSKIVNLYYQEEGKDISENVATNMQKSSSGLSVNIINVVVRSGKSITTSFEVEETRRSADMAFIVFWVPTINPAVILDAPESLEATVRFDHRNKKGLVIKKGGRNWQLEGILLPHQCIRVHWHRKDKGQEWLASKP